MSSGIKACGFTFLFSVGLAACQPAVVTAQTAPSAAASGKTNSQSVSTSGDAMKHSVADAELSQLYRDIQQMVGKAEATELAQCRKVGLGYRACGGPASYLVYSVQGLDEASLLQKVSRYNALSQAESERLGLMSTCQIIEEPAITLNAGVCQAMPAEAESTNAQ